MIIVLFLTYISLGLTTYMMFYDYLSKSYAWWDVIFFWPGMFTEIRLDDNLKQNYLTNQLGLGG